jgi:hypothetical protein
MEVSGQRHASAALCPGERTSGTAMQDWVKTLAAEIFDERIEKLVPRHDRCLNFGGDYVEK